MIGSAPLCLFCKHLHSEFKYNKKNTCEAFPDGIPDSILEMNHVFPVDGDHGILFEPKPEYEHDESIKWLAEFTLKMHNKNARFQMEGEMEKSLFPDLQKSNQPLEEWADENICRDLIKADLHLFVQALLSIKHWVFTSLTQAQSENLYTALVKRMTADKWSLKDLTRTIQEAEPVLDEAQAEAIARSESTLIVNKSREMQFERDPPGKYGYYWSGPNDHRTTEICSNIKSRTPAAGFDSSEDLSRVIKEEAQKYYDSKGYKTQVREWLPHPNCRHTIISRRR